MDTLQSALYNLSLTSVDSKTMGHVIVCIYGKKSSCKWTCTIQICVVWGVTVYVTQFVYPLPHWWTIDCISLLVAVKRSGMNIHTQVSVGDPTGNSFGFRFWRSIAGPYGNLTSLRDLWTVFHSGHIIFHSPQQDTGFQCLHVLTPIVNLVHSYYILLFLIFTLKLSLMWGGFSLWFLIAFL